MLHQLFPTLHEAGLGRIRQVDKAERECGQPRDVEMLVSRFNLRSPQSPVRLLYLFLSATTAYTLYTQETILDVAMGLNAFICCNHSHNYGA